MKRKNDIDIGLAMRKTVTERGIKQSWLAQKIDCDKSNLCKMLKNKHLYPELLLKISITLKNNFFSYYTEEYERFFQENDKIV